MNLQGAKKILFNKSSLLNLKAELLKKQEEVQGKKRLPQHNIQNFKPPLAKLEQNEDKGNDKIKKSFKDSLHATDIEELEAYKKTKAALEKKAELYKHLSNPVGDSELASKFLVDFNTKKQQHTVVKPALPDTSEDIFDNTVDDEDSEWTEFVDCLGRTRKCLKADLEFFKEKDLDLMKAITKEMQPDSSEGSSGIEEAQKSEKPILVQKTNDYLQSLREKWEQKERELLAKDKDIHYQDLLFDEARMHGVSYFAFSTDEKVRKQQMQELLARREETLRAQAEAEEKRRQREDLIAARLKASRARQRLRAGLPAEDPEENQKDFNACLLEFLNKQKAEAEARAKEEEKKIKAQLEKDRQKLRDAYIRDWDRGKEGIEFKPFKEMTQEEYVDQQRAKRIDEFAPFQSSSSHKSKYEFDNKGRKISEESSSSETCSDVRPNLIAPPPPDISVGKVSEECSSSKTWSDVRPNLIAPRLPVISVGKVSEECSSSKTWSDVRPNLIAPPPPVISADEFLEEQRKGLYFSTSKKSQPSMKYKNFVKVQEPIPIQNELSNDEDTCAGKKIPEKRRVGSSNTEIPPPPTYEYYGPVNKKLRPNKPFESDLREAYAQGAKSLETKSSNVKLLQQYDFSLE